MVGSAIRSIGGSTIIIMQIGFYAIKIDTIPHACAGAPQLAVGLNAPSGIPSRRRGEFWWLADVPACHQFGWRTRTYANHGMDYTSIRQDKNSRSADIWRASLSTSDRYRTHTRSTSSIRNSKTKLHNSGLHGNTLSCNQF